jgi:hypothetical protein
LKTLLNLSGILLENSEILFKVWGEWLVVFGAVVFGGWAATVTSE